ncbi:hypothetical protein J5N97_016327 [Dioscorea zingiberensis]|uniref:Uncharacterized protein n=1 Tax=Dioscorea zingiberensis TaxID=325984 RepID=A0A9D5CJN2_9LILI|nr:hypothetical protein J5N97_016327 [Dioscorea zingiberensis]
MQVDEARQGDDGLGQQHENLEAKEKITGDGNRGKWLVAGYRRGRGCGGGRGGGSLATSRKPEEALRPDTWSRKGTSSEHAASSEYGRTTRGGRGGSTMSRLKQPRNKGKAHLEGPGLEEDFPPLPNPNRALIIHSPPQIIGTPSPLQHSMPGHPPVVASHSDKTSRMPLDMETTTTQEVSREESSRAPRLITSRDKEKQVQSQVSGQAQERKSPLDAHEKLLGRVSQALLSMTSDHPPDEQLMEEEWPDGEKGSEPYDDDMPLVQGIIEQYDYM